MDIAANIREAIELNRRRPDDFLHPSSDLTGCLRCTQLRLARHPAAEPSFGGQARLLTGTLWHSWLPAGFRGRPAMWEVDLTDGLPHGWSGTADLFLWEDDAFKLTDFKTIKPEGIPFLTGAKDDHVAQVSAYYFAATNMGLPLKPEAEVVYIPMGDGRGVGGPVVHKVVPQHAYWGEMVWRELIVSDYLDELRATGDVVNSYLRAKLPREQKLVKGKDRFDVVLKHNWRVQFCPYTDCGCAAKDHPNEEKIGHFDLQGNYHYRKGYEHVKPEVRP